MMKVPVILTAEEHDALIAYKDNIVSLPLLFDHKDYLIAHEMPVQNIDNEIDLLLKQLHLFESIMDRIQDRRKRVIFRFRYALGMKIPDIAFIMNLSNQTIIKESRIDLKDL